MPNPLNDPAVHEGAKGAVMVTNAGPDDIISYPQLFPVAALRRVGEYIVGTNKDIAVGGHAAWVLLGYAAKLGLGNPNDIPLPQQMMAEAPLTFMKGEAPTTHEKKGEELQRAADLKQFPSWLIPILEPIIRDWINKVIERLKELAQDNKLQEDREKKEKEQSNSTDPAKQGDPKQTPGMNEVKNTSSK